MDYYDDIIEVSSSPEAVPPPPLRRMPRARLPIRRRPAADASVIIISDTEDEDADKENANDKGKGKGKAVDARCDAPVAGPSRPTHAERFRFARAAPHDDDEDEENDIFAAGPLVNLPTQFGGGSRTHARQGGRLFDQFVAAAAPKNKPYVEKLFLPSSSPNLLPLRRDNDPVDVPLLPRQHDINPFAPIVRPDSPVPQPSTNRTPSPLRAQNEHVIGNTMMQAPTLSDEDLQRYVSRVLDMFPDTSCERVEALVRANHPYHGVHVLDPVLHELLDDMGLSAAPRMDKGKRKRLEYADPVADEPASIRIKIDYASTARQSGGGPYYEKLAITRLREDFPHTPKDHIHLVFVTHNSLYAPTHLVLREQEQLPKSKRPYPTIKERHVAPRKGKERADDALEAERTWLLKHLDALDAVDEDEPGGSALNALQVDESPSDEGEGIECGCCFGSYSFSQLAQCADAHLFCADCVKAYASAQVGAQCAELVCMDTSGCKARFSETELRRVLDPKLMALYDRLAARADLDKAGIEGLEECPFCEYRCVIDNDQEKLFRCRRMECMQVSCRACKKSNHLPKSCEEVQEDKVLDAQHEIEEAMTRALMRECPKCKKGFIKQDGCNKIVCTYCRTLSCYVCRKVINGYEHFNQAAPVHGVPITSNDGRCPLWENSDVRHDNEVNAAAKVAIAKFKETNPEGDAAKFKIDIPQERVAGSANHAGHLHVPHRRYGGAHMYHQFLLPPEPPRRNLVQHARAQRQMPAAAGFPLMPELPVFEHAPMPRRELAAGMERMRRYNAHLAFRMGVIPIPHVAPAPPIPPMPAAVPNPPAHDLRRRRR